MKKINFAILIFLLLTSLSPAITLAADLVNMGEPCKENSQCKSGDCEDSNVEYNREKLSFCDCDDDQDCLQELGNPGENWTCQNGSSAPQQSHDVDYCQKQGEPAIFKVTAEKIRLAQQQYGAPPKKDMGKFCNTNSECYTNDCELSDIKLTFCDCSTDQDCVAEYGPGWECINGGADNHNVDYCQKGAEKKSLLTDELIAAAQKDSQTDNLGVQAEQEAAKTPIKLTAPKLAVLIPGLKQWTDRTSTPGETISVPYLVEYILALYRYGVIIGAFVAAIAFLVGGFLYMTAGGLPQNVQRAKEVIMGSITGLALLLGAYLMLKIINPNLVQLKPLEIKTIEPVIYAEVSEISASSYEAVTGQKLDLSPLAKTELMKTALRKATELDLPPCMVVTIVKHESGGNPGIIGHDEDYPGPGMVGSRYKFLSNKKKFNGETFELPADFPTRSAWSKMTGTERKKYNGIKIFNNDGKSGNRKTVELGSAPDYGLDWNYTHGFGLGQVTFGDGKYCSPGVRGITLGDGKCYTIPQLLTPEGGVTAMLLVLKGHYNAAKKQEQYSGSNQTPPENVVRRAFAYYAGGPGSKDLFLNSEGTNARMKHYAACIKEGIQITTPTITTPSFPEASAPIE